MTFKTRLSALQIERALYDEYKKRGYKYFSSNSYKGTGFESDFVTINPNNLLVEFEIKRSYGDFLSDLRNKTEKHQKLQEGNLSNFFYFVCEPNVIPIKRIPKYCGLIEVQKLKNGLYIANTIRIAPRLHSTPVVPQTIIELQTTIVNKYYKLIK